MLGGNKPLSMFGVFLSFPFFLEGEGVRVGVSEGEGVRVGVSEGEGVGVGVGVGEGVSVCA
jgi:hypothetical protein